MTLKQQDVTVLLGLSINGRIITSTRMCNFVTLYEHVFGLTFFSTELKGVVYIIN
jgi:hypothetical protein